MVKILKVPKGCACSCKMSEELLFFPSRSREFASQKKIKIKNLLYGRQIQNACMPWVYMIQ